MRGVILVALLLGTGLLAAVAPSIGAQSGVVVEVPSVTIPVGGSAIVPVMVRNIPGDGPLSGLGGYTIILETDPAGIEWGACYPGDPPWDEPLVCHRSGPQGELLSSVDTHSQLPGPTGTTVLYRVEVKGLSPGAYPTGYYLISLLDLDGNDMLFTTSLGTFTVAAFLAQVGQHGAVTGPSVAALTVAIDATVDPVTGVPLALPGGLGAWQAQMRYDPQGVQVLGTVAVPPFSVLQAAVDNPVGSALLWASPDAGVQPQAPVALAGIRLRLTGPVTAEYQLTITFEPHLVTGDGQPVAVQGELAKIAHRGDANSDGGITVADVLFIAQYVVGLREAGDDPATQVNAVNAASVKHDGDADAVNMADALLLAQYVAGLRDSNLALLSMASPPRRY